MQKHTFTAVSAAIVVMMAFVVMFAPGLAAPRTSADDGTTKQPQITVDGSGTISATPNEVSITAGCVIDDTNAATAQSKCDAVMAKVIAALKEFGIKSENITTVSYSLTPTYKSDKDSGEQKQTGYEMNEMVTATSHDVTTGGKMIALVSDAGANQITGIQFDLDDTKRAELKNKAIKAAMKDAQDKAGVALGVYGKTVGAVASVQVTDTYISPIYNNMRASSQAAASDAAPVEGGSIGINASVTVTFNF